MNFQFSTAGQIVFGAGRLQEAGALARSLGRRAFLVRGRNAERAEGLRGRLAASGVAAAEFVLGGEPTVAAIVSAVRRAREAECDCVIGFGGGSALDAAKAVSALATSPGEIADYLETIGGAQPLVQPALPFLAIPTTAGTGSEATRNAVLASPEHGNKVSLRGPALMPRIALIDPELAYGLPPALTAATGMDALTQLIEAYVCVRANPLTDSLCREGLVRAARSLRRVFRQGRDLEAREDMALASLFSGMALANAGLGSVHGFASPIGGRFAAPHGAVCAALLAPAMEVNLRALRLRSADAGSERRYAEVARILTGRPTAAAEEGAAWVRESVREFGIPGLRAYGLGPEHLEGISAQSANSNGMKANPIPLTAEERTEVLELAL